MNWQIFEKTFNRAIEHCLSKQKLFLVFPVLVLCGLMTVICRTISHAAGQWVQMSVAFLPIFLCAALLLGAGMVLVRIYHHEVKQIKFDYWKLIQNSKELFMGIPYLVVPLIFAYLILWMTLGIFYLVRSIPQVGPVMGSIFSFGPFLLVLGSLILGALSLVTLFFLTPIAALRSQLTPKLTEEVFISLKANPFMNFVLFLISLLPLLVVVGFLSLAAVVTQILYVESTLGFSIALKWFFIMVPFCALLSPAVIFFFNFSAEAHALLLKSPSKSDELLVSKKAS